MDQVTLYAPSQIRIPDLFDMRRVSADDLGYAWCAGFFDGEGSIGTMSNGGALVRIDLRIVNTHEESIRRFAEIMPGGYVNARPARGHRRPFWLWRATHSGYVTLALMRMATYLIVKRAEALLALTYLGEFEPAGKTVALVTGLRSHKSKPGPRQRCAIGG